VKIYKNILNTIIAELVRCIKNEHQNIIDEEESDYNKLTRLKSRKGSVTKKIKKLLEDKNNQAGIAHQIRIRHTVAKEIDPLEQSVNDLTNEELELKRIKKILFKH